MYQHGLPRAANRWMKLFMKGQLILVLPTFPKLKSRRIFLNGGILYVIVINILFLLQWILTNIFVSGATFLIDEQVSIQNLLNHLALLSPILSHRLVSLSYEPWKYSSPRLIIFRFAVTPLLGIFCPSPKSVENLVLHKYPLFLEITSYLSIIAFSKPSKPLQFNPYTTKDLPK
jgi:hypothetical protein